MKQKLIIVLISSFIFTGCATNPVLNGKNVGGVIGASGGAYGGSVLTRKSSNGVKIAGVAVGALLGWLAGSKVGEYFDKKDKERRIALIQDVLEKNKDNETSTTTYTKTWRNPNTGQTQQAQVQQSATPLRTYQPNNQYAQNNIQQSGIIPIPRNDECEVGCDQFGRPVPPLRAYPNTAPPLSFGGNNQIARNQYSNQYCRDIEITFSISVDGGPPAQNQYYRMCRTIEGWKTIQ